MERTLKEGNFSLSREAGEEVGGTSVSGVSRQIDNWPVHFFLKLLPLHFVTGECKVITILHTAS